MSDIAYTYILTNGDMNRQVKNRISLIEATGEIDFPAKFLQRFHTHILCSRGNMRFAFKHKQYTCNAGEFVFWFADSMVTDIAFSKNFKASVLFVEKSFLDSNIPDQSWGIDALLHSKEHPILHLQDTRDKDKVLLNFQLLYERSLEADHGFYNEVLQLQMQLFIFEMWHIFTNEYERRKRTVQSASLYEQFMVLVHEYCMIEREVQFYANQLHITAKYLNYVCKKNSDVTASEWIQRYARERIILLLKNKSVSIAEIADKMEFSSRSFFTRYVKKLLGVTPSEFRNRLG